MKCPVCGRNLKSIRSIKLGFGPVCYKRKFGITPHTNCREADVPVSAGEEADHNLPGQISMEDYLQTLLGQ